MSWGGEISNASGEVVLNAESLVLYEKSTGTLRSWPVVHDELRDHGASRWMPRGEGAVGDGVITPGGRYIYTPWTHIACGSVKGMVTSGGAVVAYPEPVQGPHDLLFVQPGTSGIKMSATAVFDFIDFPVHGAYTMIKADQALPYRVASTDLPGFTPPETFGMQTLNANGTVAFDSRLPRIEVFDVKVITALQIADVLLNGNDLTFNMRSPQPDVWMCLPYFVPVHQTKDSGSNDTRYRVVEIVQDNASQIRLRRKGNRYPDTLRTFRQDLFIIFAR